MIPSPFERGLGGERENGRAWFVLPSIAEGCPGRVKREVRTYQSLNPPSWWERTQLGGRQKGG